MQRLTRGWMLLALVALLSGCSLFGRTPTPLPFVPTETPESTPGSQAAATETPSPSPEPTETSPASGGTGTEQVLTLAEPAEGEAVNNPLHLRGTAQIMPFEGTLVVRVYDSEEALVAEEPIIAEGELGGPATFEAEIAYEGVPGPGRVEVLEFSARDGSRIAAAAVQVTLAGANRPGTIALPASAAEVVLPIRLMARAGWPGQTLTVTVTWDDGTQFARTVTALEGADGEGLLAVALDREDPEQAHPPTQAGTLAIAAPGGAVLAEQPVTLLHPDDPGVMTTEVAWVVDEAIVTQEIPILRTQGVARASLEALIWGPVPDNPEAYTTALPTPEAILAYPGRTDEWGEIIEIRELTIEDGIATVDFSREMGAHSGGALQVTLIRQQIEATLRQFPNVDEVVITINGVTGMLEP